MGIKIYIGLSLLLIIVVGLYVVSQIGFIDYELSVLEYSLSLPLFIWIILPLVVLVLSTVLHLVFYGTKHYIKDSAFIKDEKSIIEALKVFLLQKDDVRRYKTKGYRNLADILNQFHIDVKDTIFTSSNKELNNIVANIKNIKAGKYINEKVISLGLNSSLSKINNINKLEKEIDFCMEILKNYKQYSNCIIKKAFLNVLEQKSMTTIKKFYSLINLDKEMALKLFEKNIKNKEFGLSNDEIYELVKKLDYTKEEYITLVKMYKNEIQPDELLEFCELISKDNELAMNSYLYILFDLEMMDKAREILSAYTKQDFVFFRALLDLKDAGKHYSLNDLNLY